MNLYIHTLHIYTFKCTPAAYNEILYLSISYTSTVIHTHSIALLWLVHNEILHQHPLTIMFCSVLNALLSHMITDKTIETNSNNSVNMIKSVIPRGVANDNQQNIAESGIVLQDDDIRVTTASTKLSRVSLKLVFINVMTRTGKQQQE